MVVLIMENVPTSLRGELSRWMIEPKAGVFAGTVSAMVRDRLWDKAVMGRRAGGATLLYSSNTEQGFRVRTHGPRSRGIVDVEGLMLVRAPERRGQGKNERGSSDGS